MSRAARTSGLVLLLALSGGGSALAGPQPPSKAAAAGAKARAGLPAPAEGNGVAFEGEVWIDGSWAGSVKLAAEAGTFAEKPAWLVTEDVFFDHGEADWRLGATYTLARDLALVRGELDLRAGGVLTKWTLARGDKGLEGTRQVVKGGVEGPFEPFTLAVPQGTTTGLAALALFVRGPLPAAEKAFELPWLDPAVWAADGARAAASLLVEPGGEATFETAPGKPESLALRASGAKAAGTFHLKRKERTLLGWTGLLDEKALVVPPGARPPGAKFDEKQPARTWQDALLKFGVGHHMAREDLLTAAFHWETWRDHEVAAGSWPKERPVADFRKEWLAALTEGSQHRSRAETDELLSRMLASGRPEAKGADGMLFHAHPQFGGGVQRDYHFKRIDSVWYIVRIDSAE